MLSENAKAQIIGLVLLGFSLVLLFLICLLCPCPLRAAIDAICLRRLSSHKKKPATSCCGGDCEKEVGETDSETAADPEQRSRSPSTSSNYPKAWEQKRFEAEPRPYVTLTFSVTLHADCVIVYLYKAEGTPGPRLGLSHNNFAQVQLSEARSQFVIADVRTGVVPHTMVPIFNETLILALPPDAQPNRLSLCIQCLDFDRFSRERVVGEVRVGLPRDFDQTVQFHSVLCEPPQPEKGEILIALHYMPTAERLRLILLKANGILAPDRRMPCTYMHISLSAGGRTIFRKRSRIYEESSRPVFNESLYIDLPNHSVHQVTLSVSVMHCHLRKRVRPDLDHCLGYVIFSSSCYGSGKIHWADMLNCPRTALAYWHKLA